MIDSSNFFPSLPSFCARVYHSYGHDQAYLYRKVLCLSWLEQDTLDHDDDMVSAWQILSLSSVGSDLHPYPLPLSLPFASCSLIISSLTGFFGVDSFFSSQFLTAFTLPFALFLSIYYSFLNTSPVKDSLIAGNVRHLTPRCLDSNRHGFVYRQVVLKERDIFHSILPQGKGKV